MNRNNIEALVKMHINHLNQISEDTFYDLFGGLNESEIDEVMDVLSMMKVTIFENEETSDSWTTCESIWVSANADSLFCLSNEELCMLIQDGDKVAEATLVQKNINLLYKFACKIYYTYRPKLLEIDEMVDTGALGLLKAARRFDVKKGLKLSTYACWWIRQCIEREVIEVGFPIRIPNHVFDDVRRIKKYLGVNHGNSLEKIQVLMDRDGYSYSMEKIEKIYRCYELITKVCGLNDIISTDSDDSTERIAFLANAENVEEDVIHSILGEKLDTIITDTLTEREGSIIRMRFGLQDSIPMTLEQLGKKYNVSRERIRQIEANALCKLRRSASKMNLQDFLLSA